MSFDYFKESINNDVYCDVDILYNFYTSSIDEIASDVYIPSFCISVATPTGLQKYLTSAMGSESYPNMSFFHKLLLVKEYDENKVKDFIESFFQNLEGSSEKELILKTLDFFDWDDDEINQIHGGYHNYFLR